MLFVSASFRLAHPSPTIRLTKLVEADHVPDVGNQNRPL